MYTYEVIGQESSSVIKRVDADGNIAFIPKDEGNSDYQAYLKSLNETPSL